MVKVLSSPRADVYGQMAFDEVLVSEPSFAGEDLCRFFNWTGGPCATFGYAQFYNSAKAGFEAAGIKEFTRRPTGGGIVLHKDDLTFSLIFNCTRDLNVRQIYDKLHGLIKENFKKSGVDFDSYNDKSDYRPAPGGQNSACFTNPVGGDLMSGGVKILGGAMRRYGERILYQGSLQLKGARENEFFKTVIENAFAEFRSAPLTRGELAQETVERAFALARDCYASQAWKGKF